jgi:anti-sigma B factor antagonist
MSEPQRSQSTQPVGTAHSVDELALAPPQGDVLTVSGEIDLSNGSALAEDIAHHLDARPSVLVVDLRAVTFLGSTGLSVLVEAWQRGAPATALRVVATDRAVLRPMQISELDQVLPVYATVDEALAAD